jgi:biotin carboxyl carrier protein
MHADRLALVALVLCLAAPGCRRDDPARHAKHEGHEDHEVASDHADGAVDPDGPTGNGHAAIAGRVALAGVRGVAFAAVGEPIEEGVWRPAEAVADASERTVLTAPASGVVATLQVPPGREVGAGTPLLTLRSPELADLTATWLSRRAVREQAAAELARE